MSVDGACSKSPIAVAAAKSKRIIGIDLLRIVSMLFILILHVLGMSQGGVLDGVAPLSLNYCCAWALESMAYCGVDIFVLISGYFANPNREFFGLDKLLYFWLQVFFYSIVTVLLITLVNPNLTTWTSLAKSFFPVSTNAYWFFTAYFFLMLFAPILNIAIDKASKSVLRYFVVFVVATAIWSTCVGVDIFSLGAGYTPVWFLMLYVLGGAIKKIELFAKVKKSLLIIFSIALPMLTLGSKLVIEAARLPLNPGILFSYVSPTVLGMAIVMVVLFSRLQIDNRLVRKVVLFLSPLAFGVYLIHANFYFFVTFLQRRFLFLASLPTPFMLLGVLVSVFVLYLLCSLIDYLRLLLFERLNIKDHCAGLFERIGQTFKNRRGELDSF